MCLDMHGLGCNVGLLLDCLSRGRGLTRSWIVWGERLWSGGKAFGNL